MYSLKQYYSSYHNNKKKTYFCLHGLKHPLLSISYEIYYFNLKIMVLEIFFSASLV